MLCAVPALRALRAALPAAHITLVGLPNAGSFVDRFAHYADELLTVPGYPGLWEQAPAVHDLPSFFADAQQRNFDLALQMHGSGVVSNSFTVMLGARINAGCYLQGQYCPDEQRFLPWPAHTSEVRRWLHLVRFLGIPVQEETLEFPINDADRDAFYEIDAAHDLTSRAYVCIHPGATEAARRWPVGRFAAVGDAMVERGFRVVLTGTAAEKNIVSTVAETMRAPALDLTGRTSLGALAVLLRGARLLVCNDTGVSHLAAALRVPSAVIFSMSDPVRWAPLNRDRHRIVGQPVETNTCRHCTCIREHRCLGDGCTAVTQTGSTVEAKPATVPHVLAQADDLLQTVHSSVGGLRTASMSGETK